MTSERALQGGCFCGRNHYIIQIPEQTTEVPRVYFDNGKAHRRSQATPLSAWLRVPLTWYQSTTESYFPDESHTAIRRSYTSPKEQNAKRHFCGFCGTPLSYWSESPLSEAQYISLTLGSLSTEDLRDLDDLGLLPDEVMEDTEDDKEQREVAAPEAGSKLFVGSDEGLPWFKTLVEGSRLGNMRKSQGSKESDSGRYKIEWEIMEWVEGEEGAAPSTPKRKFHEAVEDETMEGSR